MERIYEVDIFTNKVINGFWIEKCIKPIKGAKVNYINNYLARMVNRLHNLGYEIRIDYSVWDYTDFTVTAIREDQYLEIYVSPSVAA